MVTSPLVKVTAPVLVLKEATPVASANQARLAPSVVKTLPPLPVCEGRTSSASTVHVLFAVKS